MGSGQQRLRLTFRQREQMRYVGHLDVVRTWERALRRAAVPLAYSQGFNPQPRLQFASALPMGATGDQEIVDVVLDEPMAPEAFQERVQPQLPQGLELVGVQELPLKSPALQSQKAVSEWQVEVRSDLDQDELSGRIEALLVKEEIWQHKQRKGREVTYDLRPLVVAARYEGPEPDGWHRLTLHLRSEPGATGRPEQVLEALDLGRLPLRMHRLRTLYPPATIS